MNDPEESHGEETEPEETREHRFGSYTALRLLGRGGQGAVWLAEDRKLGRKVALKVLNANPGAIGEHQLARFHREAEAASRIDHPNICALFEAGEHEGTPFLAFRYVAGQTLAQTIAAITDSPEAQRGGSSTTDPSSKDGILRIVAIVEKLARALHKAHEHGLIHRDVKPGNIMLSEDGEPVLLDFGLAREELSEAMSLTHSGDLVGTPAYMSPEQLMAHRVPLDRRTDIYSLGATLYECLTLERPFQALTRAELYQQILHAVPEPVSTRNRQVPRDLQVVVETAMEKDRNRRYQTALDLAEDLRRHRQFEPIRAKPIGQMLRLRRWAQRHPVATAVAILLTAMLLLAGVMLLRLQEERDRAQIERDRARVTGLAAASTEALGLSPRLALLLSLDAIDRNSDPEQRPALLSRVHAALAAIREQAAFPVSLPEQTQELCFEDDRNVLALLRDRTVRRFGVDGKPLGIVDDGELIDRHFPMQTIYENLMPSGLRAVRGDLEFVGDGQKLQVRRGEEHLADLPHGGLVRSVRFSTDGSIVTCGMDGKVRIWTPDFRPGPVFAMGSATGTDRSCFLGRPDIALFSPDGTRILSTDMDRNLALLWSLEAPTIPIVRIEHGSSITHLSFYPPVDDPRLILSASHDQTAQITNAKTGVRVCELRGHAGPISAAAFSQDGTKVATIGGDATLRFWDVAGTLPAFFAHAGGVMSIRFSHDGLLITSGRDGWVRIWTPEGELQHEFDTHTSKVVLARGTPLGHVVTRSDSGKLAIWKRNGTEIVGWARPSQFQDDHVLVLAADGEYKLEPLRDLEPTRVQHVIQCVDFRFFAPDGQSVALGYGGETAILGLTKSEQQEILELPSERLCTAFDGKELLTTSGTEAFLCDLQGRDLHRFWHDNQIVNALFSPNGTIVITLSRDKTARLWSRATGELLAALPHEGITWDAVFTADSRQVYTASFDGYVRCWYVSEVELLPTARQRAAPFRYTDAERHRYRDLFGR